ncbi:MAG: hypothetical protein MI757_13350 [Pirellulales bacterium]|nr:hypothetical protein [Pirellulales bacterium]
MTQALPTRCDVAVAFALAEEAGGLVDRLTDVNSVKASGFVVRTGSLNDRIVCIVETGIGPAVARRAVPAVLRAHQPQLAISAGFAGGLREDVNRGDLVIPDCVLSNGQAEITLNHQQRATSISTNTATHVGRMVSVDTIVRLPDEKRELGQRFDAVAVDMETYSVAAACRERATPLVAVRVISDEVTDEISADIAHIGVQSTTAGRVGAALGSLFRRPSSAKDMLRLREQALVASDVLAEFLASMIRDVALTEGHEPRIGTDETPSVRE